MNAFKQITVVTFGMMLTFGAHAAPIVVGSYYEDNVVANCGSQATCSAVFSTIPVGQTLLVTNVACHLSMGGNGFLIQADLSVGDVANVRREFLHIGPALPPGGDDFYTMSGQVKFFYTPGQRPRVSARVATEGGGTGPNVTLLCRIVGTRPAPA